MGRPPKGEVAKTGAQRAWEHRQRRKQRLADDAAEHTRQVAALRVQAAEAGRVAELESQLSDATKRLSQLRAEKERLRKSNYRLHKRIQELEDENVVKIAARKPNRQKLSDATKSRMAKLLGMLGSDSAGERDNAGRAIERLRREMGKSWNNIL
jgi:TolA-binding protein